MDSIDVWIGAALWAAFAAWLAWTWRSTDRRGEDYDPPM